MSLFLPYGMNAELNRRDSPFGAAIADLAKARQFGKDPESLQKLGKIAARAEPPPRERAETIGKMLMSGMLRAGAGPNGNAALQKRAQERGRFPIRSDNPEQARLGRQVGAALTKLRGHTGHPAAPWMDKVAVRGVGSRVRALKAANDRNLPMLPGVQGPMIDENALQILNALPDNRVRQGVLNAVMLRPPQNPNDAYRWMQTITALRQQITEMCEEMGLDATALTDLLDRRVEFYDPMAQTRPATGAPRGSNVGPHPDDDQGEWPRWPSELEPPATPLQPGRHPDTGRFEEPFAGADRTDSNPDFDQKLAKFFDYAKRGVDITKGEAGSRKQLEQYGEVVVKAELPNPLQNQVLLLNGARSQVGRTSKTWAKIKREPTYGAIVRRIAQHPHLTRAMKGAALALIQ